MLNQNIRIIGGNLGKDPEIRYTSSGMAIATFSVATSHGKKNTEGNYDRITTWHNITAFDKLAERVGSMAKKGTTVLVVGEGRTDQWEDQNGQKRYKDYTIANRIDFVANLIPREGEATASQPKPAASPAPSSAPAQHSAPAQPAATSPSAATEEDDLPF